MTDTPLETPPITPPPAEPAPGLAHKLFAAVLLTIVLVTLGVLGVGAAMGDQSRPSIPSSAEATTTTTAVPTTYDGFINRAACMGAAWTTVAGCNSHFPAETGSGAYSTPTTSYPSYRSSDPLQQSCGFLRDVGPSGDPSADRLRSAVLNNYC